MKKFICYFLILCTILTVQFSRNNIVNANPTKEINDTSISPIEEGDVEISRPMLV